MYCVDTTLLFVGTEVHGWSHELCMAWPLARLCLLTLRRGFVDMLGELTVFVFTQQRDISVITPITYMEATPAQFQFCQTVQALMAFLRADVVLRVLSQTLLAHALTKLF